MQKVLHLLSAPEPECFVDKVLQTLFGRIQPFLLLDPANNITVPHRVPPAVKFMPGQRVGSMQSWIGEM
jgi:hypothetical protein